MLLESIDLLLPYPGIIGPTVNEQDGPGVFFSENFIGERFFLQGCLRCSMPGDVSLSIRVFQSIVSTPIVDHEATVPGCQPVGEEKGCF